jgi:hypothetical protein
VISQPRSVRENTPGLVNVLTALEQRQELRRAVGVVVAVAEVGPSRPAVLDETGVQVPERVDDLRAGAQRVAEVHRAQQAQAPVEQVAPDPLRRERGLTDRDMIDQRGMGQRLGASGDRRGQLVIQRQPEPVAGQRLMQRGVARGQCQARGIGEDLPVRQVLEVRPTTRTRLSPIVLKSYGSPTVMDGSGKLRSARWAPASQGRIRTAGVRSRHPRPLPEPTPHKINQCDQRSSYDRYETLRLEFQRVVVFTFLPPGA